MKWFVVLFMSIFTIAVFGIHNASAEIPSEEFIGPVRTRMTIEEIMGVQTDPSLQNVFNQNLDRALMEIDTESVLEETNDVDVDTSASEVGESGGLKYTLLETVSGRIQADQSISLADYLEEAFKWVLGMVALLAVLMLIMTGVAYTAAGVSESAKTAAKNQLTSILWGVGVMLGAYILLYTINPDLLDVKLDFSKLRSGAPTATSGVVAGGGGGGGGTTGGGGGGGERRPLREVVKEAADNRTSDGSDASTAMLNEARLAVGSLQTCTIVGTQGNSGPGGRGCAAGVSVIIASATGDTSIATLGTGTMRTRLENSPKFERVTGGFADIQPGDIVITPTIEGAPGPRGHVGIYEGGPSGAIISNSSIGGRVERNFTVDGWQRRYSGSPLTTYVYRAK